MILVYGGAWQGKLSWAVKNYRLQQDEILDLAEKDPVPGYRCYTHVEEWTRRCENPKEQLALFGDAILISREIGSGVVPMDRGERFWRERHGRFLRAVSDQADSVVRVFCGLPEVLK